MNTIFLQSNIPKIYFGENSFNLLFQNTLFQNANCIVLVTGKSSFLKTEHFKDFKQMTNLKKVNHYKIGKEPSPMMIDSIVHSLKNIVIDLVIAIGGGAVLDSGKAISAMIGKKESVIDYLEGFGKEKKHPGTKVPFIAIPTTSGTGSECTKNAVLSQVGENGFKKSLRHDNFIPNIAFVDPQLTYTCPADISKYSGMDAFCQLVGSYMSTKSNLFTDSLIEKAFIYSKDAFLELGNLAISKKARNQLSYASMISGITLANAGLGIVHGFASSIGGKIDIPHGLICGSLICDSIRLNVIWLYENINEDYLKYIKKYSKLGYILKGTNLPNSFDREEIYQKGIEYLNLYIDMLDKSVNVPSLKNFGLNMGDINDLAKSTSEKNNPIKLTIDMKKTILEYNMLK